MEMCLQKRTLSFALRREEGLFTAKQISTMSVCAYDKYRSLSYSPWPAVSTRRLSKREGRALSAPHRPRLTARLST